MFPRAMRQVHCIARHVLAGPASASVACGPPAGQLPASRGTGALSAAAATSAAGLAAGTTAYACCDQRTEFFFEPKPATFSPLYLAGPERNTAACNAGDYFLYLGGGSINGAFAKFCEKEQRLRMVTDDRGFPIQEEYKELHTQLLRVSRERGGVMVAASGLAGTGPLLEGAKLLDSFGVAGEALGEEDPRYQAAVGSVFVDVFRDDVRPLHGRNVAMLYVVGPKGERSKAGHGPLLPADKFLASVERLARRSVQAVVDYNGAQRRKPAKDRLPPIEEIRWCLVSGGVYRHPDTSKLEVAKATLNGMKSVPSTGLTVTFTFDEDVFRRAHAGEA